MGLYAAVLGDVLLVTLSKTYRRLCIIEQTDSPIEYNEQTPTCNRPMKTTFLLLFFILISCEDKNECLEKSCWKIDYQKSRFSISFF